MSIIIIIYSETQTSGGDGSSGALSPKNTFSNDGSFLSKFLGMAQQQQQQQPPQLSPQHQPTIATSASEDVRTIPKTASPPHYSTFVPANTLPSTFQFQQQQPQLQQQLIEPPFQPRLSFTGSFFNPHVPPPLSSSSVMNTGTATSVSETLPLTPNKQPLINTIVSKPG